MAETTKTETTAADAGKVAQSQHAAAVAKDHDPAKVGTPSVIVTTTTLGGARSHGPFRKALTDRPDPETAAPVEGQDTVPTSLGMLDTDTVMHNRVGGVGVVHMHADPKNPIGWSPFDQQSTEHKEHGAVVARSVNK